MNMKGVFLHVLGDALGSVVVIVSSLIIMYAEGQWRFYVDPAMR
jgi:zinc transporter 1